MAEHTILLPPSSAADELENCRAIHQAHKGQEDAIRAQGFATDQGARSNATVILVGYLPSDMADLVTIGLHLSCLAGHWRVDKMIAPSCLDPYLEHDRPLWTELDMMEDELAQMKKQKKIYDAQAATRRREAERDFMRAIESQEREERYWMRRGARLFDRVFIEQQEVRRDQHCRVRELKEQHKRSLQPHYARAKRGNKENMHCQQPRTAQPSYRRRNEVKFNNASVHRPKGGKKKTQ
jgi:hypothetical protein